VHDGLLPNRASRLRFQGKDRAKAATASGLGRAIQPAMRCDGEISKRKAAIRVIFKRIDETRSPSSVNKLQAKDRASIEGTIIYQSSVKVPFAVKNHTSVWLASNRLTTSEKYRFRPGPAGGRR